MIMILTNREQQIIKTILSQSAGVSRDELSKQLNVSRRTVYRELAQLEEDIRQLQLRLEKGADGAYRITGEAGALQQLRADLTQDLPSITFDPTQRQNALLIRLLMAGVPRTMSQLADEMSVSVTTIKQDLDLVTPALSESHLTLNRQKATGVWVSGHERDVRRVLVGIFASALNPYLFFQALRDQTEATFDPVTQYFYQQLPQAELQVANEVFQRSDSLANFSDNQRKMLLLTVAVHAMRIMAGYHVHSLRDFNQERMFQDQQLALQFLAEMQPQVRTQVRVGDYQFLAVQFNAIRGGLVGERVDPFDLTVNLQVQSLIKAVEAQVDYPFSQEKTLYTALVAHIQRSATGAAPVLADPVLAHLQTDYPQLYRAVQRAAEQTFGKNAFVDNELAYLVLYFASRVTSGDVQSVANLLVVTSDGPGTGDLITTKLRGALPQVRQVKLVRISDLARIDFDHYTLILSTEKLPGFSHRYLMISPLVTEQELTAVRRALAQAHPTMTSAERWPLDKAVTTFGHLRLAVQVASDLLDSFQISAITQTTANAEQALAAILMKIPQIVSNVEDVLSALLKRLDLAPVGLPNTGLALIHTANTGVIRPYIGVFDLATPVPLAAMDMKDIQLSRVLLLLTPADADEVTLQLLSAVSSMMVQDERLLHDFETGNYSQIYPLITDAMLTEIKKIDRR